jgi:integrase/recombinase XerC
MLQIPAVAPSEAWATAWEGFELRELSRERSQLTIKNRRGVIAALARHMTAAGVTDPADVTTVILNRYLLAQYKERKPGGRVALFQSLKVFFDWFAGEYGTANPFVGVPRPKGGSAKVPVIKPEQLKDILAACKDKTAAGSARNVAIVWLLIESGLRRFELCALDLSDVDLKSRTVTVRYGKFGKARVSTFGDETAQALWRWLKFRGRGEGPLFTSALGGRLSTSGLTQLVRRIKSRSGVTVRPHMFRHSWAHYSLASGIGERNLMELAGWSSSDMLGRYGAALAQERALAAGRAVQVGKALKAR